IGRKSRLRVTCATTSRFVSLWVRNRSCPGTTAAASRRTPPFSKTRDVVVSSVKSSRLPPFSEGRAPVAVTCTSQATAFRLRLAGEFPPEAFGELDEGEAVEGRVSTAESTIGLSLVRRRTT